MSHRESEMRSRERIKEVEQDSWTCGGTKKGHWRAGAAAGSPNTALRLSNIK
jgi:hypothetical protein